MTHNIFISWSGPRGKAAAEALRTWIPRVIQRARPWMSETDIEKGTQGLLEITKALDAPQIGISCITPESMNAPWLLYEAGALARSIADRSKVCTVLLAGLKPEDVPPPLGQFQATQIDKTEFRKLTSTINNALGQEAVSESNLDPIFDALWPDLEEKLRSAEALSTDVATKRDPVEMLAELLAIARHEVRENQILAELPLTGVDVRSMLINHGIPASCIKAQQALNQAARQVGIDIQGPSSIRLEHGEVLLTGENEQRGKITVRVPENLTYIPMIREMVEQLKSIGNAV